MLFPPEIINNLVELHHIRNKVKTKTIYIVVVIALCAVLASMPFIHVDITTQARGILKSPFENMPLQSVVYAQVTQTNIKENATVKNGDTLLLLNSSKINEQIARIQEKCVENLVFVADIHTILQDSGIVKTPKYTQELKYHNSIVEELSKNIAYLKTELQVSENLFNKNITPKQEYLQVKNRYESALEKLIAQQTQFRANLETEKSRLEIENNELASQIVQLEDEKRNYIITAPFSGSIVQSSGIGVGSFVSPSQTIAYISNNDSLIAECYIDPKDIGFVKKGQNVVFQIDAFDYNQWGLAEGRVLEISPDIQTMQETAIFPVRCTLTTDYMKLKNGFVGNFQKGMTITGRFYLTERTLWQLLFDKVDDWMNPKIVSN